MVLVNGCDVIQLNFGSSCVKFVTDFEIKAP